MAAGNKLCWNSAFSLSPASTHVCVHVCARMLGLGQEGECACMMSVRAHPPAHVTSEASVPAELYSAQWQVLAATRRRQHGSCPGLATECR